jgi:hypothetical protein
MTLRFVIVQLIVKAEWNAHPAIQKVHPYLRRTSFFTSTKPQFQKKVKQRFDTRTHSKRNLNPESLIDQRHANIGVGED